MEILFRHLCILAFTSGILAQRIPENGLLFLLCLFLFDWTRSKSINCLVFLVFFFFIGTLYSYLRTNAPPEKPAWLETVLESKKLQKKRTAINATGTVRSVTPLFGNRLRVILENVQPAISPDKQHFVTAHVDSSNRQLYRGSILLTVYYPNKKIFPGSQIQGLINFSEVRGILNPGTWNYETYLHDRGIYIRAWAGSSFKPYNFTLSGTPSYLDSLREHLHSQFFAALPKKHQTMMPHTPQDNNKEKIYHNTLSNTAAAMLPALIFGDRSLLSPKQTDLIARSTLAHSLALSGLHLAYAVAIGSFITKIFYRANSFFFLYLSRQKASMLVSLPFAFIYTWLGQAPISLLRAGCMLCFFTLLLFMHKPKVMMDGLILAVGVLLLINPNSLFDISLQLSALSVAVIALILPISKKYLAYIFPKDKKRLSTKSKILHWLQGSCTVLLISFSIQVVLSPLLIHTFGTAGLWFPLNLLWLPVLGMIIMPLTFIGLFSVVIGWTTGSQVCLYLASLPCEMLLDVLSFMDKKGLLLAPAMLRPHAFTIAGFWILCLSIPSLILKKDKLRFTIITTLGTLLFTIPLAFSLHNYYCTQSIRLRALDVGQGQAILIEWPGGKALVDGGGVTSATFDLGQSVLAPILTNNSLARLDWVINTHPDLDHFCGLPYLLERFTVGGYAYNGDLPKTKSATTNSSRSFTVAQYGERLVSAIKKDIPSHVWKAGDIIPLSKGIWFEVLWPEDKKEETQTYKVGEKNDRSLVLNLVWEGKSLALLCGDISKKVLRQLVKIHGNKLATDVIVVPHHGSATGLFPLFYDLAQPSFALASCGYQNIWNLPAAEIRNALANKNIPLYTTADCGQISIEWSKKDSKPRITTARQCPKI